jgi:hypothetical protein
MNLEEFKKQSGIRESAPLTSASFSTKSADDAKYGTDAFGVASKYADKFLRGTKDVMVGIGKQAANTVLGVSRLGERYLMNPLTGGAFAKNKFSADVVESALPAGALEQKNLAQKAGGLLFDIGSFAIPSTGVAKIATRLGRATGTALKVGGTAEKVANLAQKATTLGGISAGEGLLGTAYGAIQEGQLNKEALTQGAYGAILPVAFAGAGKVLGASGDLIKFGATKASGLERETVEQIIKGKVPKEAMEEVNRQALARKVGNALTEEKKALSEIGQSYNEIRQAGEGIARVEMGAFQEVLDKYKVAIKNGKLVRTAETRPMSKNDIDKMNEFFQTYSGDLDANKFLNARKFLANEGDYNKLTQAFGKTDDGAAFARDLRALLNKQADNFTVGSETLGKLDADFSAKRKEITDVYKAIMKGDGTLKPSAYSTVANLNSDAKIEIITALKKYIPDIDEQVRVLKAVEDISRTMNTKTGTYIASILQGGGVLSSVATGNPAFLLTLLANPKFIIPMLRWYGAVVGKSNAFVQAVMKKILGGEALDQAETKFVQETLETATRKSKKLSPKTQPKQKTFLQKAGDRIKQEFTAPGYTGKLKPGQKIPEGYSTIKTALKDNRGMQATGLSDNLIQEAKKYKSADEFIKSQQEKVLSKFDEESIFDIQGMRHDLHSLDNGGIFSSESSSFGKMDKYIDSIADNIEKLDIVGNEKEVAQKIRKYSNTEGGYRKVDTDREFEEFTDEEWNDYIIKAYGEISEEKNEINNIIENYLKEIDEEWDKYALDDISDIRGEKTFKPSGYARARSVLGTGENNTSSEKYYDNELFKLKDIWNKANPKKLKK